MEMVESVSVSVSNAVEEKNYDALETIFRSTLKSFAGYSEDSGLLVEMSFRESGTELASTLNFREDKTGFEQSYMVISNGAGGTSVQRGSFFLSSILGIFASAVSDAARLRYCPMTSKEDERAFLDALFMAGMREV